MTVPTGRIARLIGRAALALALAAGPAAADIRVWTTVDAPERLALQRELAAAFEAQSGIAVEVVAVAEGDLESRAAAAFAAGELPDVISHPLQHALPWAEAGLLDTEAAAEVIGDLGPGTFAAGPLEMVAVADGYASVPVDGWTQMILYRADLFERAGLAPPETFADLRAAIDALHAPPRRYGFVAPTRVETPYMAQVLEHLFLANGVSPVDGTGIAPLDPGPAGEVLDLYAALVAASPPGELSWAQSRALYLSGEAAMIAWSPFILDELAGLQDSVPGGGAGTAPVEAAGDLAARTGVVTDLAGPSNPGGAAWAEIRYLGITAQADTGAAAAYVRFALGEGYDRVLAVAPEGRVPVRRGTPDDPRRFERVWAALPMGVDRTAPLGALYDAATVARLVDGLDTARRWGVEAGRLSLASRVVNSRVVNRVARDYADGLIDASGAIARIDAELAALPRAGL